MRMVSTRDVWALFQVSIAFIVTEFFSYKLVHKEGLNSLQVADEIMQWLWILEQKINQMLKTGG